MHYFDLDSCEEISEDELLEIVAHEIELGFVKARHCLEKDAVNCGGLSYFGGKSIYVNSGYPNEKELAEAKDGELYHMDVFRYEASLDSSVEDWVHEELILTAKTHAVNWISLKRAIFRHVRFGWPMARPYWDLLEDLVFDRVTDAPKDGKYKKTKLDYLAYMIAAKNISERFKIKLTRNDGSNTVSALDLVASSAGIAYATLKKEAYIRYHNSDEFESYW